MALIDLSWLPPAPADFRSRCKEAVNEHQIRGLAAYALNSSQLNHLAKALVGLSSDTLTPLRLGLLGNATTDLLVPALKASAIRHGVFLDVVEAPFDQALQSVLDPASVINMATPDIILMAFDHRIIPQPEDMADPDMATGALDGVFETIDTIRDACGVPVIVQTLAPPAATMLGSFDLRLPGSPHALVGTFNTRIVEHIAGSGDLLLDVCALSSAIGLERWHDPTLWHLAKLSFSQDAVPLYADHVARLLGALKGKSRKCLILDLDNTLWGGVVGDDGLDGIVIGQGDPVGEAFVDIQRTALHLKNLGIILAVSSKNDDANARQPFREHPDMLLKESDIAVFQANWNDKASNLEAIADALDIGLDALVLLDDNPAERAQVRDALPMVAVPELPDNPALFPATLMAAGYFETLNFSDEDRLRAGDYTARARRIEMQSKARDMESFLASLDMKISFAPFDATGRGRITQLINKSNQFNLTTRRYTEQQVKNMESDSSFFTLQVRLKDRFGDSGIISVVICAIAESVWEIDTWLMSCRVLGRRVEEAVLAELVRHARAAGAMTLRGRYIPSGRNALVEHHYEKLGFGENGGEGDETCWILTLDTYVPSFLSGKF